MSVDPMLVDSVHWCCGCASMIDPECCGCDEDHRGLHGDGGHPFVPMGCNCRRHYLTPADEIKALRRSLRDLAAYANTVPDLVADAEREENEACEILCSPYHTSEEPCPCQVCTAIRKVRELIRARRSP